MECGICYYSHPIEEIFELFCCKNNHVCQQCIKLLVVPLCPFCRTKIPGLENKRMAVSYENPSMTFFNQDFIDPRDDIYIDSRILRRQMKRLRKLQERERERIFNRNLSAAYRNSKKSMKNSLQQEIREEQFHMDE
jgi:hypothetical protein